MSEFPFDVMRQCLQRMAYQSSEYEMEDFVRDKMKSCLDSNPTPTQLYDCMTEIAALPCDRIVIGGKKVAVGVISGFVQAICDVKRWYLRPGDK